MVGTETEVEDDNPEDAEQQGFFVIDLGGTTVDLTQVVGEKAISVFDGELPEGRYTKIELYAASIEGVVDGRPVDVMIPSDKLQIVKPFDVIMGETLSFVFDINVVKKGQTGEYNLLPVISENGVTGTDVDVDEITLDAEEDAGARAGDGNTSNEDGESGSSVKEVWSQT